MGKFSASGFESLGGGCLATFSTITTADLGEDFTAEHPSSEESGGDCHVMLDRVTRATRLKLTLQNPAVVLQANHASETNSIQSPADVPIQKLRR